MEIIQLKQWPTLSNHTLSRLIIPTIIDKSNDLDATQLDDIFNCTIVIVKLLFICVTKSSRDIVGSNIILRFVISLAIYKTVFAPSNVCPKVVVATLIAIIITIRSKLLISDNPIITEATRLP